MRWLELLGKGTGVVFVIFVLFAAVYLAAPNDKFPFNNMSCPYRAETSGYGGDRCW